jgi:hypothetical protein
MGLCNGPCRLKRGTLFRIINVKGIYMTGTGDWDCRNQFPLNATVEQVPRGLGWPATILGRASADRRQSCDTM